MVIGNSIKRDITEPGAGTIEKYAIDQVEEVHEQMCSSKLRCRTFGENESNRGFGGWG